MVYQIGDKIIAKKKHACGGDVWQVVRFGADVKLRCEKCGHAVFLSVDKTDKIVKKYIPVQTMNGGEENV